MNEPKRGSRGAKRLPTKRGTKVKFNKYDVLDYIAQEPLVAVPAAGARDPSFYNSTLHLQLTGGLAGAAPIVVDLNAHYQIPRTLELAYTFVLEAKLITVARRIVIIKQSQL